MSKYAPLQRYLSERQADEWSASFAEIEKILGFKLPASAGKYQAWWANQATAGHSQTYGWREAGWQTCELDLRARRVGFRRIRPGTPRYVTAAASEEAAADDRVYEEARRFLGIETQEELVREGVKALIEREASRHLAALGGTMPDFVAPPRRRIE